MKKYTLPKELATKWVAALRSGEYKQTTEEVYEKNGCYCAVGLAYKVNGFDPNGPTCDFGDKKDPVTGDLFTEVVNMNDDEKVAFPEIADWLCDNVEFV